ncbi:DUF5684 domain-containing protein, partial [Rhizobium johnstonii]|uniref:DUF5684 domain-containing protein n=1 Tax=Rhizobium johnstonii TaxID=3019933 RepID=UPI003F9E596A
YVWTSIALARVFAKLGEPHWKAWVPLVNSVTLYELGGYSALWVLASLFPVVNIVALVMWVLAINGVNKRFGKVGVYTAIAFFFYPIWASVLGFGKAQPVWTPPGAAQSQPSVNVVVNNGPGFGPLTPAVAVAPQPAPVFSHAGAEGWAEPP